MSKAQFQQMKSTEAVHIRLPHRIQPCSASTDLIADHKPSMYSSADDKEEF